MERYECFEAALITSKNNKQRLDVALLERGHCATRNKAQALVLAGQVKVNDVVVNKVGTLLSSRDVISLVQPPKYVSRGGEKLEGALADFSISPADQVCLDVGASTGGFTDCLLQHGAAFVFALDVGRAQLDEKLKQHRQVKSLEETHIVEVDSSWLDKNPTLVVIDVSFISLKKVLPPVFSLVKSTTVVLPMVKPQFEVGPKNLKKGVVRSVQVQQQAVQDIVQFAIALGFDYVQQTPSKLKGPKGNQEYFLHLIKK